MTLAFSSKHPFVPNPKQDPNASRWIASLSDGSTVFEDVTPHERSAWLRLRDYLGVHKLKLTNLRLEAYGRQVLLIPYRGGDDDTPQLNGYFQSKRMNALLSQAGVLEMQDSGIGYLKGKTITITWVSQNGNVQQELRLYKDGDLAVFVNDCP